MLEIYYYIPNQESVSVKIQIDKKHPHIVPTDGVVSAQSTSNKIQFKVNSLYMANNIFVQLPNFQLLQLAHCAFRQEMCIHASINLRKKNQVVICYIDSPLNAEKLLQYIGCKKFFSWYPKSTS